ncbi:para-aminobenzoate synthetase / 4-amino-4-deoxychorismate lyase [Pelagirhabdus alkalitolerans]|uniref:Para-aminobenzoate synthetase / 4-amino-4-deoxychorismate lyase n=1 Tax=Pelagirhabdus alkalitolerans TaxID=1612202 RepID=A0A1G6MU08_9BACI|nr:aminodeoxychorismate synthase component I [Pelagirhabdus alkalitolerans]SDC59040.1 para-aminobenzoate synthetase / 4-amino-4-deoxychorismate lyase [Pelagirhabdus alkalitolerans]
MKDIKLRFDFNDEGFNPIQFTNPKEVYVANQIDEVIPLMEKVQKAVRSGDYVAGYLSYEAAPAFNKDLKTHVSPNMPIAWFACFSEKQPVQTISNKPYKLTDWQETTSYEDYESAIQSIKQAIRIGDTYQVNYTTRLLSLFKGSKESFYHDLTDHQQANYSAYLNIGDYQILSASPELFFKVNKGKIETKPMKGTHKRGRTLEEDQRFKHFLTQSAKERAENLMIVDLLRNDIGKIAEVNSVHVPEMLTVETYPTVHQMTSTVRASLKRDTNVIDWFRALFPCGSITGAPKIKTMDYIKSLETTPRDVYCGAIGYITPDEDAIFNVPIRTVVIDDQSNRATYGVGGGITWDSQSENEYEETKVKARLLTERNPRFSLLESMLLENGDFPFYHQHLNRLKISAEYFQYKAPQKSIEHVLTILSRTYPVGRFKVRVQSNKDGQITVNLEKADSIKESPVSYLAKRPIDSNDPFLYHKTTHRQVYWDVMVRKSDNFSTLLYNEREELTEFTIGNVVLEIDGVYYTPPTTSGLLAGVYREKLIYQGVIKEHVLTLNDLNKAASIWFINGVRGWVKLKEVKN